MNPRLVDLEPWLAEAPNFESSLTVRLHQLAAKPIDSLAPSDLALCLRQRIAAPFLASRVVEMLVEQPFLEAEFYPGDLLVALLEIPSSVWLDHPTLMAEIADLKRHVKVSLEGLNKVLGPTLN